MLEDPPSSAEPSSGLADHLTCPTCRYSLRGLREAVCPECGEPFDREELLRPKRVHPNGLILDIMGQCFALTTVLWSILLTEDLLRRMTFRAGRPFRTHGYHGLDSDGDVLLYLVLAPMLVILAFAGKSRWPARAARIAWLSTSGLIVAVWILVDRVV